MATLSQHFPSASVIRDAEFTSLGYVDAQRPGVIAYSDTIKYVRDAKKNPAISCLITTPALAREAEEITGLVVDENPRLLFFQLHEKWLREGLYTHGFESHRGTGCRIHPSAIVAPDCWIGDNVIIGEYVIVRGCVRIGSNVVIEPGVKLGVEGILYQRTSDGPRIIQHGGTVSIGDHTALMAGSTVVRSVHDTEITHVGRACIIGLGAIVGHEARVEDEVVVSNGCVLARRCQVGKSAFLGTGAFIREHVKIGAAAQVMAGSVVIDDVDEGATVSGNFASDHRLRMMEFVKQRKAKRP